MKLSSFSSSAAPPRLGSVDLTRFISALFVMTLHSALLGSELNNTYWAWVEYFFMLTGYFTMSHFMRHPVPEESGKEAVAYTFRKFFPYAPHLVIALVVQYLIQILPLLAHGHIGQAWRTLVDLPYEALLLSASGLGSMHLEPIWYLSAMFIMLPLLCLLLMKCRKSWPVWALLIPVLYYGKVGVNTVREQPINDLLRAFAAMTLGTLVYYAVEWLRARPPFRRSRRNALTALEIGSFAMSVYITSGTRKYINLLLLTFFIQATLSLSGTTATARIGGKWSTFLAKLSLPMYLFHWNTFQLLAMLSCPIGLKRFLYYALTLALSAAAVIAVESSSAAIRRRRGQAEA